MIRTTLTFVAIFIFVAILIESCNPKPTFSTDEQLKRHISILASDSLLGREAGTDGEIMARDYIISQFENIGLKPYFESGFSQQFTFKDGADFSDSYVKFNSEIYKSGEDFYPLNNSKNAEISAQIINVGYGIMSQELSHNDYPNHAALPDKIFLMEMSVPGGYANFEKYGESADLDKRIELASRFGAQAVLLVNNDSSFSDPRKMISNLKGRTPIPVITIKKRIYNAILANPDSIVSINVSVKKFDKTGFNVAGYLDNQAEKTIIIGAHYDHLGMGGETSLFIGRDIHNGADDNASGVAGVIEMARHLKDKKLNHNFLFVTFSAEEKGLNGSNYFVDQLSDSSKKLTLCYLNFDMIGRLDTANPILTLIGTGTAVEWDSLLAFYKGSTMKIKKSPSGVGGSDHMPFYLDSIPVMFFFSGIHSDYHRPSDDEQWINYKGMLDILSFTEGLIDTLNYVESLNWKATQGGKSSGRRMKDGPSLGIMPDYSEQGGVLVNMVSEGKPGHKAGLKVKDLIVELDNQEVKDVYDYMDILKKCKKGETYSLKVKRDGEIITLSVTL